MSTPVVPVAKSAALISEHVFTASSGGSMLTGVGVAGSFRVGEATVIIEAQYPNNVDASALMAFGPDQSAPDYSKNLFRAQFTPTGDVYYSGTYGQTMPVQLVGRRLTPGVNTRVRMTCSVDGTVRIDGTTDGVTWINYFVFPQKATGVLHCRFYVPENRKTYQLRQVGLLSSVVAPTPVPTPPPPPPAPTPPAPSPTPGDFNAQYVVGWKANTGTTAQSLPAVAKPAMSESIQNGGIRDLRFDTLVRKVTSVSHSSDATNSQMRHEYSRRQPWNVNSTRYLAQSTKGFWFLYDANTLDVIDSGGSAPNGMKSLTGFAGDCEPFWHPTDPNKIWHTDINGGLVWYEYDIVSKTRRTLFNMAPHMTALGGTFTIANVCWFNGEGSPSNDGRYWGFHCESRSGSTYTSRGFVMYDRVTNTIVGKLENPSGNRPNWVGTTPLGSGVGISFYGNAAASLAAEAALPLSAAVGARVYSRDFSSFKSVQTIGEHSDFAVGADGAEYYCAVTFHGDSDGVQDGSVFCRNLVTGAAFSLPLLNAFQGSTGTGFHISGRAINKPGWLVIGKYNGVGAGPYDGQVIAAEMKPNGIIKRLAHHHSNGANGYFSEPHPVPNRDLTRVVFSSDWNGSSADEDYVICLPTTA